MAPSGVLILEKRSAMKEQQEIPPCEGRLTRPSPPSAALGFGWVSGDLTGSGAGRNACEQAIERVVRLSDRRDRCVSLLLGPSPSLVAKTTTNKSRLLAEWMALRHVGTLQIAPNARCHLKGTHADLLLEDFSCPDDAAHGWSGKPDADILQLLEETLMRLYQCGVPVGLSRSAESFSDWLSAKLAKWTIELRAAGNCAAASRGEDCVRQLRSLSFDASPSLLHGDLRPENILFSGGRCVLIDFEHASVGEPLFDLAKLKNSLPLHGESLAMRVASKLPGLAKRSARFLETRLALCAEAHAIGVLAWESRRLQKNPQVVA